MASTLTKTPYLRTVATRGYAQLAPIGGTTNYELKSTVLPNKLVVVSAENDSPLSRVSIVFRAGSRNETSDNLGATHVLRASAGLSTKNASQFAITRNIQQVGASLTATSDREVISYTLEGTRQAVESAIPFLKEVASQQVFKPWELAEIVPRLRLDLATRPLQLRAIDLLHKAAYRTGLGNSLFIPKHHIGKINSETLQHYVASNFTSGRAAVVGVGVSHSELTKLAQSLPLPNGDGSTSSSPYKGGEIRSDKGGDIAYVAIGGEGASLKNSKESLAYAVLAKALGGGPQVKYSPTDNGLINKAIGGTTIGNYAVNAVNTSYSDTGLFGIILAAPSTAAGPLVDATVKFIKSAGVSDEDVTRGKNQLKTAILLNGESGSNAVECLGVQAALTGCAQTAEQLAAAVDSVSTDDVTKALTKVGRGKLTIASVGNLKSVPFLDEIK